MDCMYFCGILFKFYGKNYQRNIKSLGNIIVMLFMKPPTLALKEVFM